MGRYLEVKGLNWFMKEVIRCVAVCLALPGLLFSAVHRLPQAEQKPVQQPGNLVQEEQQKEDIVISVAEKDGTISKMRLEDYVLGVVLGEMPASFETEALKAQAVAARTYALRCQQDRVHEQGAVCKQHTCCQSYCDPETYNKNGDKRIYLEKVRLAVEQTAGEVITYDGKLIFAAYFASSGGSTEDAVAVWGKSFPYLKPVDSPGETDKSYQNTKVSFTAAEFQSKLGTRLSGDPATWFGKVTYTDGGGVKNIVIGGKQYTGVKIRSLLGLRSTVFSVSIQNDKVTFTTNGYGHRVGMSQYGAEAMALTGCSYEQIIQHYYSGAVVEKYPFSGD